MEANELHAKRMETIEILPEMDDLYEEDRCDDSIRRSGLGDARKLTDEVWLMVLHELGPIELGRLACCSKAMCAFSNHHEIWKRMILEEFDGGFRFESSWKDTYLKRKFGWRREITERKHLGQFRSNLLYQSWICANVSIEDSWIDVENVDRRSRLSQAEFRQEYELPNKPVVITDIVRKWPALKKWSNEYLMESFGDKRVHAGGYWFSLGDYVHYMEAVSEFHIDDQPLYLFDKGFVEKAPSLAEDYTVPVYFQEDYFSTLGKERPDHRWLIVGPARSGSSFHQDPNCTSAWNAVIRGAKKWILFPPHCIPPGVHPSADGAEVATPVSLMEWFLQFYSETKEMECKPYECICREGDLLYVPRGWWHLALNLTDTVAITQNYVNSVNLKHVLRFLKTRNPDLISGVEESKRPYLADKFEERLRSTYPCIMAQLDQEANERDKKMAATKRLASIFLQNDEIPDGSAPTPFRFRF